MLLLTVATLAKLVEESPRLVASSEADQLQISLQGDMETANDAFDSHMSLLTTSISELLSNG
jgi:hypothetical protein